MTKERVLVVLWTTSKCNLKCKYCYASTVNQKLDMDFQIAIRALDYFKDRPMKIQFAGGEPLLNYNLICKVYEYVKQQGYDASFQMQTNGTLIDEEKAKALKNMNIALGVSIDGPPNVNEWLRGKTKEALEGIQALAKEGVIVNINSVVTSYNIKEIPKLADLAMYLGNVAGIGLDLLRNAGRAKEGLNLIEKASGQELKLALNSLSERCEVIHKCSGKKIVVREIEEAKKRLSCSQCSKEYCYASCGRSFVILPNGDVYPCGSLIDNEDYYMGNIKSNIPLREISLIKQDTGKCDNCNYANLCSGGCPSRLIINKEEIGKETLDCVLKKCAFEIASRERNL